MRFLLSYFRRLSIETPEVMEAYATIDAKSKKTGISMGKNDIWIAAMAHVNEFNLVASDGDFDHLHPDILTRTFIESS